MRPVTLLFAVIGLCAGFASCDDDDEPVGDFYNEKTIAYAYVPHTGDGVTTEWTTFSAEYTNSSDTVMTVHFNPCKGRYDETMFIPDDPASLALQGVNFRDTMWVADIRDDNGNAVAVVGREIPYLGEIYRSEPDWSLLPDFTFEVPPHTSVYYDGYIRTDHIVAHYTLTLENARTLETKEYTGTLIKKSHTAWAWGEHSPIPGN